MCVWICECVRACRWVCLFRKPSICFAIDNSLCQFCCLLILFTLLASLFLFFQFFFLSLSVLWAHVICCFLWFPLSHAVDWLVGWQANIDSFQPPIVPFRRHIYFYIDSVGVIWSFVDAVILLCWEKENMRAMNIEQTPSFDRYIDEPFSNNKNKNSWWVILCLFVTLQMRIYSIPWKINILI